MVHINETLEHETSWNSPVPQVVQKKKNKLKHLNLQEISNRTHWTDP